MIAGKGLALEYNLVTPIRIWTVEGRHEKMQIGGQGGHDGNLARIGADNWGHRLRRLLVRIEPCRQRRIGEWFEMAKDTLCRPRGEILVQTSRDSAWLEAQRISAQVDARIM